HFCLDSVLGIYSIIVTASRFRDMLTSNLQLYRDLTSCTPTDPYLVCGCKRWTTFPHGSSEKGGSLMVSLHEDSSKSSQVAIDRYILFHVFKSYLCLTFFLLQ
ncbi:hypothetical protein ALC53_11523, partial [Atta colombica]